MLTPERIETLKRIGYTVEDMGAEHGSDFKGLYRWLLDEGATDHGGEETSRIDAWNDANNHYEQFIESRQLGYGRN